MGSGTRIREAIKKEGIENFEKTILEFFENKDEMLQREKKVVNKDFIKREDTYNIIIGGGKLTSYDCVPVRDLDGNTFMVNKLDERYLRGELVHVTKGKIYGKKINITNGLLNAYKTGSKIATVPNWNGKTHSEETKTLMRENRKGKQAGSNNSQFGKTWITNGKNNKKIFKGGKIPKGWKLGRKIK